MLCSAPVSGQLLVAIAGVALAFAATVAVIRALNAAALEHPRLGRKVRFLLDQPIRAIVDYHAGDVRRALAGLRAHRPERTSTDLWLWNILSFVPTAAGEYRAALRSRPRVLPLAEAKARYPGAHALTVVNKAEALYSLGRWKTAERLLCALAARGTLEDRVALGGATLQLAWILAHTGRGEVAQYLCEAVPPGWPPADYRAEVHFTRAAAALAAGAPPEALAHLDQARRELSRETSRRNELFLRARVLAALGDTAEAEACCARAAAFAYTGQGGDGLLLWGDLLQRRGARQEAREKWRLVAERDPESEGARVAARQLLESADLTPRLSSERP